MPAWQNLQDPQRAGDLNAGEESGFQREWGLGAASHALEKRSWEQAWEWVRLRLGPAKKERTTEWDQ